MTQSRQRQSMLAYQEQVFEHLRNSANVTTEKTFITVMTESGLGRVDGDMVSSIERLTSHAAVPNIQPWIFGIANIRSRAITLVDLNAWRKKCESLWRATLIPEGYTCLLLKNGDLGVVCQILPEIVAPASSITIDLTALVFACSHNSPTGE